MSASREDLAKWILEHMATEAVSELDLYKEEVAEILSLSPDGKVILRVDRTNLDTVTEILLILLGRAYAAAAGLVESDAVKNNELANLGLNSTAGGQRWALTKLREENLVASMGRGANHILPGRIGAVLKVVRRKLPTTEAKVVG